jgi:serine/threonine-protein kinase
MRELTIWKRRLQVSAVLLVLLAITTLITMELAHQKDRVLVPDVVGAAAPQAIERLKERELKGKIVGDSYHPSLPKGSIVRQDPPSGSGLKRNRTVSLIISRGSNELFLPDYSLQRKDSVRTAMGRKGLVLGELIELHSYSVPKGHIIAQSPPPGTKLRIGDAVSLLVSQGPQEAAFLMPDLIGRDGQPISKWLRDLGFKVELKSQPSFNEGAGQIVAQEPPSGYPVVSGSKITLALGKTDLNPI